MSKPVRVSRTDARYMPPAVEYYSTKCDVIRATKKIGNSRAAGQTDQSEEFAFSGGGELGQIPDDAFFDPISDPINPSYDVTPITTPGYPKMTNDQYYAITQEPAFRRFVDFGYEAPGGVAIRKSNIDRNNEMFVAGTRYVRDWMANMIEAPYYMLGSYGMHSGKAFLRDLLPTPFRYRKNYIDQLDEVAARYNVKRVFGHSRAAGLVSEMNDGGRYKKIGLDGAMILARDKDMLNITTSMDTSHPLSGMFDGVLALGGTDNYRVPATAIHQVWL